MFSSKFTLAATAALLASTSLASAASITVTASYSANTNWGTSTQTTGFSPTYLISVTPFNTSLGTLTSVEIDLTNTVSGTITLTNTGVDATNVNAFLTDITKLSVSGWTPSITVLSNSVTNPSLAGGGIDGPHNVTGTDSRSHTWTTGLSAFEVAWGITAGAYGAVTVSSGNGNGIAAYSDTSGLAATVKYFYTPQTTTTTTPEPATMALLGAGLAGLALVRRRRRS